MASAIEHFEGADGPKRILDLGTGPGTLLLAALDVWPNATGLGIDLSSRALSYAAANARRLGFEARVKWTQGNWAEGLAETFDLILCNPPYIAEGADLVPGRPRVRARRGAVRRRGGPRCLSRAGAAAAAPAQPRRPGRSRNRPRPGRCSDRAARPRRPARARRRRPRRPAARRPVNIHLNEIAWQMPLGALHQNPGPGPLHHASCRAHPVPTPDAIGRSTSRFKMRRPEREGQSSARSAALPARREKGLATTA